MPPALVTRLASAAATLAAVAAAAAPPARFAAPLQPWASADGRVHLLRPLTIPAVTTFAPLGSLMAPGWRLLWDGATPTPGQPVVRLAVQAVPAEGPGVVTEVLQVGVGADPASVRTCLAYGLAGPAAKRLPDRLLGGTRFRAWRNGDAGMSQQIDATDLRAVVEGRCYAVERFAYTVRAVDRPAGLVLPQARAAAMLDAALASLRLGRGRDVRPPALRLPPGAVARG